jgi:hypothetical protein
MFTALQTDSLAGPYRALLQGMHREILEIAFLGPQCRPEDAPNQLALPLKNDVGKVLGIIVLRLAPGTDVNSLAAQIQPVLDCLSVTLTVAADTRDYDLKLLRLANELDLDFREDTRLDKAVAVVAQRLGAHAAWFAAPRSHLSVTARGQDQELDASVRNELSRMRARIKSLTGKLRRPLLIDGTSSGTEQAAECHLLLVPLFVGRARHNLRWLAHGGGTDVRPCTRAPARNRSRSSHWPLQSRRTRGGAATHQKHHREPASAGYRPPAER